MAQLWLVPVSLPGRHFTAQLAVWTPADGGADAALALAQLAADRFAYYAPDARLKVGQPERPPPAMDQL